MSSAKNKPKTSAAHRGEAKKPHKKGSEKPSAPAKPAPPPRHVVYQLAQRSVADTKGSFISLSADSKGGLIAAPAERGMSREYARTMLGMRPFKTVLAQALGSVVGTANAIYAGVLPADLVLCPEFSSFAGLFDEVRTVSVEHMFIHGVTTTTAATGAGILPVMTVWDPAEAAALSSVGQALTYTRHTGPQPVEHYSSNPPSGGGSISGTWSVHPHGHTTLTSGRLPRSMFPPDSGGSALPLPVGGDWVPTTISGSLPTALTSGWFKFIVGALGVGVQFVHQSFLLHTVEFRFRD